MILDISLTFDRHVHGTVNGQHGLGPVPFDGWLDLMGLLESLADDASDVSGEDGPALRGKRPRTGGPDPGQSGADHAGGL